MLTDNFPLQATVLSEDALSVFIKSNYFTENTQLTCRLFYRSIHDIYRVVSPKSIYYYKVYRQNFRCYEEIQSEIDVLNYLKDTNIKVAYPISQNDGTYIGQFQTVFGYRYGVLYESAGERGLEEVEENEKLNEDLGSYIASIHMALDMMDFNLNRWELSAKSFIDDSVDAIIHYSQFHNFDVEFLIEVSKKTKEKLNDFPKDKPMYGLCHGDFYAGNIKVNANNKPMLFDFDFCGKGWRLYDISMYAYPFGMGFDSAKFDKREQRKNQFLNGYCKVRNMSAFEMDNLPLFIPFRRIFNIGTLYINLLHNTWGDYATIHNIDNDIVCLKKWLDLNPVL